MTMLTPPPEALKEGLSTLQRYCDNCGKPFEVEPLMAPHKRFCCTNCRNQWHYHHKTKPKREEARNEV